MIARLSPDVIARGTREQPLLIVVTNLGAGGTPDLIIGSDPLNLALQGIHIGAAASSPQITITEPMWIVSAGAAVQSYNINVQAR